MVNGGGGGGGGTQTIANTASKLKQKYVYGRFNEKLPERKKEKKKTKIGINHCH